MLLQISLFVKWLSELPLSKLLWVLYQQKLMSFWFSLKRATGNVFWIKENLTAVKHYRKQTTNGINGAGRVFSDMIRVCKNQQNIMLNTTNMHSHITINECVRCFYPKHLQSILLVNVLPGNRTHNLSISSALHCPLSYTIPIFILVKILIGVD